MKKEIERKWLLNKYAIPWKMIKASKDYKIEIVEQQYLAFPTPENNEEIRIRRVINGSGACQDKFFKTTKVGTHEDNLVREEEEIEIPDYEYYQYFDKNENCVKKERHTFEIENIRYEMDIYHSIDNLAVVEIEFKDVKSAENFNVPGWFGKDVTNVEKYKNVNLAQHGLPNEKRIFEIALTGGPCSGKSTALAELEKSFTEKGIKILTPIESATEIMSAMVKPWEVPRYAFQRAVMDSMLNKEKSMRALAENYRQGFGDKEGRDVVIFYDRALADNKAYCDENTWKDLLMERNLTEADVYHRYDAIFSVETTAIGAVKVYLDKLKDNPERYEQKPEEARKTEERIKEAWAPAEGLNTFKNESDGWEGKKDKIFNATYRLLGMDPVIRNDKRFLVDVPNIEKFLHEYNCVMHEIEQIYLKEKNNSVERRIRKIVVDKSYAYYYTEKMLIGNDKVVRSEKIDREIYRSFFSQVDETRKPIHKKRYPFTQKDNYFVLDVFEEGKYINLPEKKSIVESKGTTNLENLDIQLVGFEGTTEITGDPRYDNATLSLKKRISTKSEKNT